MQRLPPAGTPPYAKWELPIFALMGVAFGYLAHYYLRLHQRVSVFMRPYNRRHPIAAALAVAAITAFVVYVTGAYSDKSVSVIALVSDVLNGGAVTEMRRFHVAPMGGLFVSLVLRVCLTLLATNILVPGTVPCPSIGPLSRPLSRPLSILI